MSRDPAWIEHVVADHFGHLPPIRKAFIYVLLKYLPENPEEDDRPDTEYYADMMNRAIEDAIQAFEDAED